MAGKQGATYMKRNIASTSDSGIIIPVLHFIRFQMFFIQWNVYYHTVTVSAWSAISCSHRFRKWHDVEIGLKILNTNTSKINALTVFACSLCINFTAVWVISLNNEKCVFLLFPDGIWTPRLSGRPFQHHNVQFYCISNLFKNTMILTPNTPKNYQGQKFSLSLSFSFKRAQLSVTHSATKKEKGKKKLQEFSGFKMDRRRKLCIPPMTMVWYCSKWNTPPPLPPPPSKHVLRPHYTQVWVKVITWQWSNSL